MSWGRRGTCYKALDIITAARRRVMNIFAEIGLISPASSGCAS